jgi:excisionase family DNA binding protein
MGPKTKWSPSSILAPKWDNHTTLTIEETAEVLGLSRGAAYDAANKGLLPVVRIGRRLIVPRVALERLLADAIPQPA